MINRPISKPVHKLRAGAVELAVWKNDGEKGSWYSVSATRSYKHGEEWKQSDSFGQDDLLDMAYSWIWNQQQQAA
jgi:hypothetical protein